MAAGQEEEAAPAPPAPPRSGPRRPPEAAEEQRSSPRLAVSRWYVPGAPGGGGRTGGPPPGVWGTPPVCGDPPRPPQPSSRSPPGLSLRTRDPRVRFLPTPCAPLRAHAGAKFLLNLVNNEFLSVKLVRAVLVRLFEPSVLTG